MEQCFSLEWTAEGRKADKSSETEDGELSRAKRDESDGKLTESQEEVHKVDSRLKRQRDTYRQERIYDTEK